MKITPTKLEEVEVSGKEYILEKLDDIQSQLSNLRNSPNVRERRPARVSESLHRVNVAGYLGSVVTSYIQNRGKNADINEISEVLWTEDDIVNVFGSRINLIEYLKDHFGFPQK